MASLRLMTTASLVGGPDGAVRCVALDFAVFIFTIILLTSGLCDRELGDC